MQAHLQLLDSVGGHHLGDLQLILLLCMEKQKLADLVLQKMREKKELEQKSRPHYQILRLQVVFEKELNQELRADIAALQSQLTDEKNLLAQLEEHLQQLDHTGKKDYPRIIVKPEFIACEKIETKHKDFYRKSANTFLRADIIRNRSYEQSIIREEEFMKKMAAIRTIEEEIRTYRKEDRKIYNEKRVKVLAEDLRLRGIREEQRQTKQCIEEQRQRNIDLLNEYELKKVNLQERKDRLKYVQEQIVTYKKKIEAAYNPVVYREFLKNIFMMQAKNEVMKENLKKVMKQVEAIQKKTNQFEKPLLKDSDLVKLGRVWDSPSHKKGKLQRRLHTQNHRSVATDRSSLYQPQRSKSRQFSNSTIMKIKTEISEQKKVNFLSPKHSMKTTDRSFHPRYKSDFPSRKFF